MEEISCFFSSLISPFWLLIIHLTAKKALLAQICLEAPYTGMGT